MGALYASTEEAIAYGLDHPSWYIFPGILEPDGVGGFLKRPLGRWTRDAAKGSDSDGIRATWSRHVGDGKAIICVACQPSGIWVLDDDRDLPEESGWRAILADLETMVLRSCTKARPHYVFAVPADGSRPKEGKWEGGDVKSSGIIFLGDAEPILDLPPAIAPTALLDKLGGSMVSGKGATRAAASSEEMWDWFASITHDDLVLHGAGPEKFLDLVLERFRHAVSAGDHRRQACRDAVWSAVKESASGFYLPEDAYWAIRELYRMLREESDGTKGWTPQRERDYELMWAGAVAAVLAGDLDDDIEKNLKAIDYESDSDLADLMAIWDAIASEDAETPKDGTERHETAEFEGQIYKDLQPLSEIAAADDPKESQTTPRPDSATPPPPVDPPRAWETPADEPEPEPEADPNTLWASPASVPKLSSSDSERPVLSDSSPVWDTVHGKLARALSSGSAEVSDIAMLATSITYAGTHLSGLGTHYIGADAHNPVVWSALVGRSAAARKSMSLSLMNGVFYGFPGEPGASTDLRLWEPWLPRKVTGFNSGEILIDSFMPPVVAATGEEAEETDTGYFNPRAIAVESEMDRLWTVASREGSVLGVILCNAWDGSELQVRSRGAGVVEIKAGEYVLGLLGAATESRAIAAITRNDGQMAYSGLANRHLWFALPDETMDIPMSDGSLPWGDIYDYRDALGLRAVRSSGVPVWGSDIGLTEDAKELWHEVYPWLKRGSKAAEGEVGREMLTRAEAQVRRLALNFALSRPAGTTAVDAIDFECALSIWEYCRSSVRYLLSPERSMDAPSRLDGDIRRSIWSIFEDRSLPGWATNPELTAMVRKDRGTIAYHIKRMVADGVLVEGIAAGVRGRKTVVVASKKRLGERSLMERTEGSGSHAGLELSTVKWDL